MVVKEVPVMDSVASVRHLSVTYGAIKAVEDVSFEVAAGEIVAVIGPNGSGKTSMVECLEGLRRESAGQALVFGKNPHTNRREVYTRLGVQLQDVQYPDKIRVGELCSWFSALYENPADWQLLLAQLGLENKKKRSVCKLSGGEKQRLSILLALLPKPRFLMLDELTTGLDPEIRRSMWESLKTVRDSGIGVLLVSHYMEEVEALADRVVFMVQGKAIFVGSIEGLREYAKTVIPPNEWADTLSLEDIYLRLIPEKGCITMEAIL